MQKTFLKLTWIFYILAFISACVTVGLASNVSTSSGFGSETGVASGYSGGAAGFGIITSSFIFVGSFFLYKYLTNKPNA
jgi:hypothetical protein